MPNRTTYQKPHKNLCVKCFVAPRSKSHRYCRECRNKYMRAYRKLHGTPEAQKEKDKARSYAGVYKRRGHLIQQPCEVCGSEKSEMHHNDYTKPLDVRWFCRKHHLSHHRSL